MRFAVGRAEGDFLSEVTCRDGSAGFPEVVFGQGKPPDQVRTILAALAASVSFFASFSALCFVATSCILT